MNDDRDEDSIQTIQPTNFQDVTWFLAPSKSHMIRWILLASMSDKKTRISFSGKPGEDIHSMANCIAHRSTDTETHDLETRKSW